MNFHHQTRRTLGLLAVPALLVLLLVVAACSGGSGDSDGSAAEPQTAAADEAGGRNAALESEGQADGARRTDPQTRAIISTGSIELVADDVDETRFDLDKVITEYDGEVADERTFADEDGDLERTKLVLRVPSEHFADAMKDLSGLAHLESATRSTEDVTTQVIDNQVRIRAQEKSLRRIEALLARAEKIGQIITIESTLSKRQADLESLKSQRAYLEDQTSLSTITVHLERSDATQDDEEENAGFLGGLAKGWDGMTAGLAAFATGLGVVLPFAVLLLLVAVPVWLLVRTLRRRRPLPQPTPAEPGGEG